MASSAKSIEDAGISIPEVEDLPGLYRHYSKGSSEQVSLAVAEIERRIVDRSLVAGQRLIEADIATDLGIARGRVREALRILAGEGMIELIPNRGARVSTLSRVDTASMMEVLAGILLTGVDAFGKRHGVPGPAIARAILAAADRIGEAAASGNASMVLIRQTEFHVLINHLSGNAYLNLVVSRMNIALYEKAVADAMSPATLATAATAFGQAARMIVAGKGAEAHRLLQQHVDMFIGYLRDQS